MKSPLTSLRPSVLSPESARQLLRAVGRRFHDGRCAQVAASLAFTTLLSLVPFVTLVAVVFSRLPPSARLDAALRGFLLDNLLPEKAGKVIATYALQFSQKATNLTIAGAVALILTTVLLMRTIDQVINEIWMVRSRRPWATRLAAYWVALSFGPGPGGRLILDEPELHLGKHVLVPDLSGWRRERMPALPVDEAYFSVAPDWVCEVLTASTAALERGDKLTVYRTQGVAHVWLIDPVAQTLELFELTESRYTLRDVFTAGARCRAVPFDAIELDLGLLWLR